MDYNDNILGTKGIIGENLSSGVGFVIIPPGVDLKTYKEDCFSSNTISMTGFDFGHIHNVPVDKEVMQRIEFPKRIGEMGSPVVFVNIPKHNVPVVVACLKNEKDVFKTHEKRIRKTKTSGSKIVDMDMDADDARVSISATGDSLIPAIIELLVKGNNSKNYLKVEVDGTTFIKSKGRILMISNSMHELVVLNKKGIVTGKLKLSSELEERLFYEDEFGNKISITKDKINIRADKSSKIQFGEGKEDIALAETLISKLKDYDKALGQLRVPTAFGPSGTRLNSNQFTDIIKTLDEIRSKLIKSD